MELKIDENLINKLLTEAVANSEIGKTIAEIARTKLAGYDFKREVELTVQRLVFNKATEVVEKDPLINKAISDAVAAQITPELIATVAAEGLAKLNRY